MKHIKHRKAFNSILRFLCVLVALSFFAALVPIAGAFAESSMPCCAGKAGHCDSGLDKSAAADDPNTIVAEPLHNRSSSGPAAEPISVHPCRMDCGACATSSRQQRRDKSIVEPISSINGSLVAHALVETSAITISSNENREQTSPRGPPPVR